MKNWELNLKTQQQIKSFFTFKKNNVRTISPFRLSPTPLMPTLYRKKPLSSFLEALKVENIWGSNFRAALDRTSFFFLYSLLFSLCFPLYHQMYTNTGRLSTSRPSSYSKSTSTLHPTTGSFRLVNRCLSQ